jgi:hypothetical protein
VPDQVLKLAALRIRDICERLDFEPLDCDAVCVQARLVPPLPTHLFTHSNTAKPLWSAC